MLPVVLFVAMYHDKLYIADAFASQSPPLHSIDALVNGAAVVTQQGFSLQEPVYQSCSYKLPAVLGEVGCLPVQLHVLVTHAVHSELA